MVSFDKTDSSSSDLRNQKQPFCLDGEASTYGRKEI